MPPLESKPGCTASRVRILLHACFLHDTWKLVLYIHSRWLIEMLVAGVRVDAHDATRTGRQPTDMNAEAEPVDAHVEGKLVYRRGYLSVGPIEEIVCFCDLSVREKDWRKQCSALTSPLLHARGCARPLSACTTH